MPDNELLIEQTDTNRPPPDDAAHSIFFGEDGLRAGWSLLIYVAILAFFSTTARMMIARLHHPVHQAASGLHEQAPLAAFLGEGIPFLLVALATWIMSRIEHRSVTAYGFGGLRRLPHFFAGLAWGVGFLSILVFTLKAAGLLVFDSRLLFGANITRYGAIWLVNFLLVALFEEYLLRGFLQFTLSRGLAGIYGALDVTNRQAFGFWTAAFVLSFVFGLGHGSNPGESPIGLLSAGIAGLVFCLSLWRTGSLWWAIGFHTSWDWAQSFFYGVADSGTMVKFHLFATHAVGKPIFSGGLTGPEGSILIVPVMALIAATIVMTLPKQAALLQSSID